MRIDSDRDIRTLLDMFSDTKEIIFTDRCSLYRNPLGPFWGYRIDGIGTGVFDTPMEAYREMLREFKDAKNGTND